MSAPPPPPEPLPSPGPLPSPSPAPTSTLRRRPEGERGAASVMVLSLVAVVLVLTAGGLVVASVVVASHRARVAADLGALAGASAMQDGVSAGQACSVAHQVVRANGAATQSCSSTGGDLELRVEVRAALWPEPATARSRAGPER